MSDATDSSLVRSLATHFIAALSETTEAVRNELALGRLPTGKHSDPKVSHRDNGMPYLSDGSVWENSGLLQYADLLDRVVDPNNSHQKKKFEEGRFPHVDSLANFIQINPVSAKFSTQIPEIPRVNLIRTIVELQLQHAINRFFQRYGNTKFHKEKHKSLLMPVFRGLFNERLDVTNVIPIALVKFDFAQMRLANDAYVFRMSDNLQKKRWLAKAYGAKGHDSVVSAATHAFALKGWSWPNANWLQMPQNLAAHNPTLRDKIEELFAALRLVTGVSTGYAQELRMARGWSHLHDDQPPEVYAAGARRYPEEFDDYGWTRDDFAKVSRDQIRDTATALCQIRTANNDRLALALRRMNGAMIRSDVADSILDVTIALEILLSDGDSQSISYKLRMRGGALANLDAAGTGSALSEDIKHIYEARSRIVHGGTRSKRKGGVAKTDQEMQKLAIATLRKILTVILNHPKYADPKKIDADLLLT